MDRVTKEKRSAIMRSIKGKNTTPEMKVRKLIFSLGYRYRLHAKNLPGKPDLVFPGRKKVIFVHGCFWHYHGCKKGQPPKSRLDYWFPKLEQNRTRDIEKQNKLRLLSWSILIIWQCELKNLDIVRDRIINFLENG